MKLWDWIKKKWPYEIIEISQKMDIKSISKNNYGGYSAFYLYNSKKRIKRKRKL